METKETIIIDRLSSDSVNIMRRKYVVADGVEYLLTKTSDGYSNNALDRARLAADVPEPYLSGVMAVWGDTPTKADPSGTMPQDK